MKTTICDRSTQMKIVQAVKFGNIGDLGDIIRAFPVKSDWHKYGMRLLQYITCGYQGKAAFTIFARGNNKLPFYVFSTLPIVTCPGAMECIKHCYSLKAWRYPGALFLQCQNYLLLKHSNETLRTAFNALPRDITFRLYVDGDFSCIEDMSFWFSCIAGRSDVKAYGYSKSWHLFLRWNDLGCHFPINYVLNLSNGSKFENPEYVARMKQLSCVRGQFVAVAIDKSSPVPYREQVAAQLRAMGHKKVMVCPGKCDSCVVKGHACGLKEFKGVTIGIGIH